MDPLEAQIQAIVRKATEATFAQAARNSSSSGDFSNGFTRPRRSTLLNKEVLREVDMVPRLHGILYSISVCLISRNCTTTTVENLFSKSSETTAMVSSIFSHVLVAVDTIECHSLEPR
jgi:hypothetical protein